MKSTATYYLKSFYSLVVGIIGKRTIAMAVSIVALIFILLALGLLVYMFFVETETLAIIMFSGIAVGLLIFVVYLVVLFVRGMVYEPILKRMPDARKRKEHDDA